MFRAKYIYMEIYMRVCMCMCGIYIYLLCLAHLSPTSHQRLRKYHPSKTPTHSRSTTLTCQLPTCNNECRNRVATGQPAMRVKAVRKRYLHIYVQKNVALSSNLYVCVCVSMYVFVCMCVTFVCKYICVSNSPDVYGPNCR